MEDYNYNSQITYILIIIHMKIVMNWELALFYAIIFL